MPPAAFSRSGLLHDGQIIGSNVVPFGRTSLDGDRRFLAPFPAEDEWMILTAFVDVPALFDEHIAKAVLRVGSARTELRQPVDDIFNEVEAVHVIQDDHV